MVRPRLLSDEEILSRARPIFMSCGIHAKTRQLAAAIGLTWGALALRFGSKRALFERAMAQPPGTAPVAAGDLGATLRRLRDEIAQRWPMSMQMRLSSAGEGVQVPWLRAALQAHAERGLIRCDLPIPALASLLLAAFTGATAEGFLSPGRDEAGDDGLLETLLHLLG